MYKSIFSTLLILSLAFSIGCSTENPLCTENYCVTGEIFARADLQDDQEFSELPANINEDSIKNLWTLEVNADFQPTTVTGIIDWDFFSSSWEYTENGIYYLKKVTLEIVADNGQFGVNREILVHLNNDTISTDADGNNQVSLFGTESINLTHHIGIGEYKGDIVDAPVKE